MQRPRVARLGGIAAVVPKEEFVDLATRPRDVDEPRFLARSSRLSIDASHTTAGDLLDPGREIVGQRVGFPRHVAHYRVY